MTPKACDQCHHIPSRRVYDNPDGYEGCPPGYCYCPCHDLADSVPELLKALRAMVNTHGMHGPCRDHGCKDCRKAYDEATKFLWDETAKKWRA